MYKYLIILLLISSFAFAETPNEEYIFINGTIRYIPIEGGFCGIIADDGKEYDPINLDQNFATDGLKVKVKAKILKDAVSFHMWGEIIEIIEIESSSHMWGETVKIIKIEPSSPQSKGNAVEDIPDIASEVEKVGEGAEKVVDEYSSQIERILDVIVERYKKIVPKVKALMEKVRKKAQEIKEERESN